MREGSTVAQAGSLEILTQWEGLAIPAPGVLYEKTLAEHPDMAGDVSALAAWIAVTALSSVNGNSTLEALKKKVLGVLSDFRRRFGQAKINEVKNSLYEQMQQNRNNRKLTDEELRERIESLFAEIQA
jgi:hypothetical protein